MLLLRTGEEELPSWPGTVIFTVEGPAESFSLRRLFEAISENIVLLSATDPAGSGSGSEGLVLVYFFIPPNSQN
jgi:hypothetical protein